MVVMAGVVRVDVRGWALPALLGAVTSLARAAVAPLAPSARASSIIKTNFAGSPI